MATPLGAAESPPLVRVRVDELLAAKVGSQSLTERIRAADVNEDGVLSLQELIEVFKSEHAAKHRSRRLLKVSIGLATLLTVMLVANAGLTYAVVALSKDTSVSNSVLVAAGDSSQPIQTASYEFVVDPATGAMLARGADGAASAAIKTGLDISGENATDPLLYLSPQNVTDLHSLVVYTDAGFEYYQVTGAQVLPGQRTVLFTAAGTTITIALESFNGTNTTVIEWDPPASGAGGGGRRRLLAVPSPLTAIPLTINSVGKERLAPPPVTPLSSGCSCAGSALASESARAPSVEPGSSKLVGSGSALASSESGSSKLVGSGSARSPSTELGSSKLVGSGSALASSIDVGSIKVVASQSQRMPT